MVLVDILIEFLMKKMNEHMLIVYGNIINEMK